MGGKAPGEGWGRQASSECSLTLGEGSVLVWRGCGQPRAQIQILREFSGRNTLEGCVGIEKWKSESGVAWSYPTLEELHTCLS